MNPSVHQFNNSIVVSRHVHSHMVLSSSLQGGKWRCLYQKHAQKMPLFFPGDQVKFYWWDKNPGIELYFMT